MAEIQRHGEAERLIAELAVHVRGLGERRDLAGVMNIREVAVAAERYAEAKRLGNEAERYAAEIATRAERRIGQLLAETPKRPGPGRGKTSSAVADVSPRKQVGEKVSARSQQLAAIPDDEFERRMADQARKASADRVAREARQQRERREGKRRADERAASLPLAPGSGLRFAYADPPYLGQGALYPEHADAREWDDPARHHLLIRQLESEYPDGWALSASSPSLRVLLPMCPADVRVGAWVKPFAAFKANVRVAYTWEPVIWRGGRLSSKDGAPVGRDHLSQAIMMEAGLTGAKPPGFCRWVAMLLGYDPARDALADLFPGTGIMADALEMRA